MTRSEVLPGDAAVDRGPTQGVFLAIVDFPLLVAGYRVVIDAAPDLRVVGVVESREKICEEISRSAADIVITEYVRYASSGCASFQAIEEIRAARPTARILAVECRRGGEDLSRAMRAGADACLSRETTPRDVLAALRCVRRGETYVSPSIVTRVDADAPRSKPDAPDDAFDTLSERAREIFRLAAVGRSSREIARGLHVSEQTVHNQRAMIMEKLGFHGRVELLRYALRRGIIEWTEL